VFWHSKVERGQTRFGGERMRGLYNIILIHYGGVSVDGWLRTKKTPGQRFGAVSGKGGVAVVARKQGDRGAAARDRKGGG